MAASEPSVEIIEKSENNPDAETKTIFNILSKLKEVDADQSRKETDNQKVLEQPEESDDIVILRRDPNTKRNIINKTSYLKLHRNLSPNRSSSIDKIKEQYENNDQDNQANTEVDSSNKLKTLESIKNKYSPAGLGYTKPKPAPRPRIRSQIILPSKKDPIKNARLSLNIEKNKNKDVNSNDLPISNDNLSTDEEFISIVTRSDSEESIYKIQKELSAFTMDKKKRANSFRKIFSVFSNKDKKKSKEDKNKSQNRENGETYSDNFHNESNNFSRHSPYRHTTGGESKSLKPSNVVNIQKSDSVGKVPNHYYDQQLEKDYAQMHINQFNRFKQNFETPESQDLNSGNRVARDDYPTIDQSVRNSSDANATYRNISSVRKYIDTSSSASTLESERSNLYQNEVLSKSKQNNQPREEVHIRQYPSNSFKPSNITDGRRDTPPRLLETQQDVRLVNPKALIPINSERPLPNPYQNGSRESAVDLLSRSYQTSRSTPTNQGKNEEIASRRPYLEETYSTVVDSIEERQRALRAQIKNSPQDYDKPPRSPSLEPSKLKLPPNRDTAPLSPRVRSPIPSDNISTEKIIATELLKPKRSSTPTKKGSKDVIPSHQRLEIDIDYPDNVTYDSRNSLLRSADNLAYKPPVAAKPNARKHANTSNTSDNYRISQASPHSIENTSLKHRVSQASPIDRSERGITNVQIHSPINRTPTPNNSVQNLSLSPSRISNVDIRPSTPSGSRIPESPKTTPQKEDMRKSVEAYYWKEIKKLKDQENQELYLLQMQYGNMFPYGYAEEPVNVRRSRSMSPSAARNGRRSLSLPRETRPPPNTIPGNYYPNAIPENRAVVNQMQPRSVQQLQFQQQQQQNFNRSTPERRTFNGNNSRGYENNTNSLYRPIFKRGSLNTPPSQVTDDSLKRKVSFSGAQDLNVQSWPTKNGFTQSPPQRRMDKLQSQGDDEVFLPNTPIKSTNDNRFRYNEANFRSDLPNEEMYYNTRHNIISPNGEQLYVSRNNQNALYLQQRQATENPYGHRISQSPRYLPNQPEEVLRPNPTQGLTRHGSIQINEELYGQRPDPRRMSYQYNSLVRPSIPSTPVPNQEVQYVSRQSINNQGVQPLRREIILNDEIFGQFGGYVGPSNSVRAVQNTNVFASRQSIAEYNSRVRDEYYNRPPQRRVSVTNRVCDIYGKIHDSDGDGAKVVQQSGMIMGQLNQSPGSPAAVRMSHSQLSGRENFVRNSRLTASANDMYRRVQLVNPQYPNDGTYGRIDSAQSQHGNLAPNRPLPPVPNGKNGVKGVMRQNFVSDTESGSDASEVQRILNSGTKTKKRGIFGK